MRHRNRLSRLQDQYAEHRGFFKSPYPQLLFPRNPLRALPHQKADHIGLIHQRQLLLNLFPVLLYAQNQLIQRIFDKRILPYFFLLPIRNLLKTSDDRSNGIIVSANKNPYGGSAHQQHQEDAPDIHDLNIAFLRLQNRIFNIALISPSRCRRLQHDRTRLCLIRLQIQLPFLAVIDGHGHILITLYHLPKLLRSKLDTDRRLGRPIE